MPDFNKLLLPGDYQKGLVNIIVEIPKGSTMKIEWDNQTGTYRLDRVEPAEFAEPFNYGFIPQTLSGDNKELDVLLITERPVSTGVWLPTKIVGLLKFEDNGQQDDKVVVVPVDDRESGHRVNDLTDLGETWQHKVEHYFNHYKDFMKSGSTRVIGWDDAAAAKSVIADAIAHYHQAHS
jgi:inorganic pyrophosphatase